MGVIYKAGKYIVKRTSLPSNRPYKVINTLMPNEYLHTHLRTEKEAIDLVHFSINRKIPVNAKVDYLVSLRRIINDTELSDKIDLLILEKKSRQGKEKELGRRKLRNGGKAKKF